MCKVTREKKKERAILYMKELGLFKPCIKNFEKYDEVQMSEPWGGLYEFSDNEELNKAIKEFEEEYDSLVYHVIHANVCGMDMYSFLCVSDYEEDWELDIPGIRDGYVFTYTWNKDIPEFSEYGSIGYKEFIGGLIRTA